MRKWKLEVRNNLLDKLLLSSESSPCRSFKNLEVGGIPEELTHLKTMEIKTFFGVLTLLPEHAEEKTMGPVTGID